MSTQAIIIPERGAPITADRLVEIEAQLAAAIPNIENFEELEEYRAKARALEHYLRDKEMQGSRHCMRRSKRRSDCSWRTWVASQVCTRMPDQSLA